MVPSDTKQWVHPTGIINRGNSHSLQLIVHGLILKK